MYRTETDFLGEKSVPAAAYYGIHTVRALENFAVSRQTVHPELIRAIATVKQAAAEMNLHLGLLDPRVGSAIFQAAGEVAEGRFADQFPLDALQGGAGTSTNMNVNEVIANRACELLGRSKGDYAVVHLSSPEGRLSASRLGDVLLTRDDVALVRLDGPATDAVLPGVFLVQPMRV